MHFKNEFIFNKLNRRNGIGYLFRKAEGGKIPKLWGASPGLLQPFQSIVCSQCAEQYWKE